MIFVALSVWDLEDDGPSDEPISLFSLDKILIFPTRPAEDTGSLPGYRTFMASLVSGIKAYSTSSRSTF